ncbi:MAG TPA: thiamine pyrophosphate-binding protein, partial [Smithellaceae bacterium]|nr:thiamine pyrophosphate-binding protein [Smithellaceae bacterium]
MLVGEYLMKALEATNIRHVFGIQGDYVLKFYELLSKSPLEIINVCDEQSAGFAADAYARIGGFGVVCVTYGVGGLKLVNSTAQAFAEHSPVLVISGSPGTSERSGEALLHHKVRSFQTQLNIFKEVTVAQATLEDKENAAAEIDRVIDAILKSKRPGYIELPRDMLQKKVSLAPKRSRERMTIDQQALAEAVNEVTRMLAAAHRPVVVAGIDVHRFGVQQLFLDFLEHSGLPFVTGVLGKGVIPETHPQFLGVYAGAMSPDTVREAVEGADFIIGIGPLITDLSTGMFTSVIDKGKTVAVEQGSISVAHHVYPGIPMADFLKALTAALPASQKTASWSPKGDPLPFSPQSGRKITMERLILCVNVFLDDHTTVIAEPGDPLFAGLDLFIRGISDFLSPAYYASLGFAIPACVGVQLASPGRRALALVGDGSFQMTGMEISTLARYGLNPIIIVLNNGGYGTFRPMVDGPFNDIQPWRYADLPKIVGSGTGFDVTDEEELFHALQAAKDNKSGFSIIDVRIDKYDISSRLKRL